MPPSQPFSNRMPDKNIISFAATLDLSVDIMLSSWAKVDCYELDFSLRFGKPPELAQKTMNFRVTMNTFYN